MFRETLYGRAVLTSRLVADDTACEVGRWLLRHENSLGHLREYRVAKDVHVRFHGRAVLCLRLASSGHRLDALAEVDPDGELRRLSRLLILAFQDLKRAIQQQSLPVSWDIPSLGARPA